MMQFQILINNGRINPVICIMCRGGGGGDGCFIFSPTICLGEFLSSFLMTSFTSLSVAPLVFDAASKLNHWDSSQK